MTVVVFGGGGMLGRSVAREAEVRGLAVCALPRSEADITSSSAVERRMAGLDPELLINCAALTDVDGCESRPEEAMAVNGRAVGTLVAVARRAGVPLVQVSTDYVFDGLAREPYREEAATAPQSVYGRSKLAGEQEAASYEKGLVIRTSWLFGPAGRNFVSTMIDLADRGHGGPEHSLRVVDDQLGCPTYTPFLAAAIFSLAEDGQTGVIHYRNREAISWFGFAESVFEVWGIDVRVEACTTAEFPRPARRPSYSVLEVERFERIVGGPVETWRRGLEHYRDRMAPTRPHGLADKDSTDTPDEA